MHSPSPKAKTELIKSRHLTENPPTQITNLYTKNRLRSWIDLKINDGRKIIRFSLFTKQMYKKNTQCPCCNENLKTLDHFIVCKHLPQRIKYLFQNLRRINLTHPIAFTDLLENPSLIKH